MVADRSIFFEYIFTYKKEYKNFSCSYFSKKPLIIHKAYWRDKIKKICCNEKEFSLVWDFFNDGITYNEFKERMSEMGVYL